jgi:DNA-binding NtrC family response regulator
MNEILLCSSDPIFLKNLYSILREEGYFIEIAGHMALAIRMALEKRYAAVILDSEEVGLSAAEAARILLRVIPEVSVILPGENLPPDGAVSIHKPLDLEEVLEILRTVCAFHSTERSVSSL